ncbi:adenosine-deaminase domain-containing protein [Diplocarpon mali]|nr:adenosine-deaminase domain-containing protein [Diplocarpon mali]
MGSLKCLAAATGMKCLPQSKIGQAQGIVLHDWHAEILAIRSFNRFLLEECHELASSVKNVSDYIRLRSPNERTEAHFQPFALKEGISFHMYCSEAPCTLASPFLYIRPSNNRRWRCEHGTDHGSPTRLNALESTFNNNFK